MAPKGNKNAVGHGRPPNPGFEDAKLIQLGEELLAWMKKQDDDPESNVVHLSEWYDDIKQIPDTQWDSLLHRTCFLPYYNRAKRWMGRRILKSETLPQSYGNRFLAVYFKEIKDAEKEIVEHKVDYELKKKQEAEIARGTPPNQQSLDSMIEVLNENKRLKEEIDALKSKTDSILPTSDKAI